MDETLNKDQKQLKPEEEEEQKIQFLCYECGQSELVDYYGRNPPFVKNIEFLEDNYIMKNPFSAPPSRQANNRSFTEFFINIGANCVICKNSYCKDCSLFYSTTFCYRCAIEHVSEFPLELRSKIRKKISELCQMFNKSLSSSVDVKDNIND